MLVLAHDRSKSSGEVEDGTAGETALLEEIGAWLAKPHASTIMTGAGPGVDGHVDYLESLRSLLQEGIDRGNEFDVVTAYAEALVAWEGLELHAYVEDADGQLAKVFTAPGAPRGHTVIDLEAGKPPRTAKLTPLSREMLAAVGLPRGRTTVGIQLETPSLEPWVLLCAETFGLLNEDRLVRSLALLQEALERAAVIAETRMTWSLLQSLLSDSRPFERTLEGAIQILARSLKASSAHLTVAAPDESPLLVVGDGEGSERPFGRPHQVLVTTPVPDRRMLTLTLTLRRAGGEGFTRRDEHLAGRAAAVLAAWMPPTVAIPRTRDRRSTTRQFEQVLERTAAQTLRDGLSVSVMVVALQGGSAQADVLQGWVTDIRGRLRGSDLAGLLSDSEIGVLLSGTPGHEVATVRARLESCLVQRGPGQLAIGTISRDAGHFEEEPLVRSARMSATPLSGT
jgi:hypothetical protein